MPTTHLESLAVIATHLGQEVAVRSERVQRFAAATDGSTQVTWCATVEREGGEKLVMVADWIARLHA